MTGAKITKQCNEENFLADEVVDQVREENLEMSSYVKLLVRVQRNASQKHKIWKPNKFHISPGIA